jgi:16S rRNA processing protein RimM
VTPGASLEIGRIGRPFGLKGAVYVELFTDRTERVAPGHVLETERGPLTVASSAVHGNRQVVSFEGVHDRNAAERWRGVVLHAAPLDDDDALWIHTLFGATVETVDGVVRGTVTAVEANPASDLLVLDNGQLVPLTFVVTVEANERIVVDTPEGLFE